MVKKDMRPMSAALIIEGGRILLAHNTKHGQVRIEPPGGKKHADESHEGCARRECLEELGIEIETERLFGVYPTDTPEGGFIVRIYLARITKGRPELKEPDKISGFGWYTIDEVEEFKRNGALVSNMADALPDARAHIKDA